MILTSSPLSFSAIAIAYIAKEEYKYPILESVQASVDIAKSFLHFSSVLNGFLKAFSVTAVEAQIETVQLNSPGNNVDD